MDVIAYAFTGACIVTGSLWAAGNLLLNLH